MRIAPCHIGLFATSSCDHLFLGNICLAQHTILKTVCAFLALVWGLFGVYGDGEFKWYYGYPYMAVVLNFSQTWALYCLAQFYNVTHKRLEPIRPLPKFIRFLVAMCGHRAILCIRVLPREDKLQSGLQNYVICNEVCCFFCSGNFVSPYQ
ncbi:hypothetical protein TB2_017724 [Malus domestica]